MQNDKYSQSIGNPVPMNPGEGRRILKRLAAVTALSIGGILAVVHFATPTRLAGTTRSAKLRWQQRQQEALQVVHSVPSGDAEVRLRNLPVNRPASSAR
jgi:hypothetical protein